MESKMPDRWITIYVIPPIKFCGPMSSSLAAKHAVTQILDFHRAQYAFPTMKIRACPAYSALRIRWLVRDCVVGTEDGLNRMGLVGKNGLDWERLSWKRRIGRTGWDGLERMGWVGKDGGNGLGRMTGCGKTVGFDGNGRRYGLEWRIRVGRKTASGIGTVIWTGWKRLFERDENGLIWEP